MLKSLSEKVVSLLKEKKLTITTMESCTSGLLLSTITNIEGASKVTEGGYITYSNDAKIDAGVSEEIINRYGVYSAETALAMANMCKLKRFANIGIGVTGTFSNVDPNNIDSKSGEVYYCIKTDDLIFQKKIFLPTNFEESDDKSIRLLQKEYVVEDVFHEIYRLIKL